MSVLVDQFEAIVELTPHKGCDGALVNAPQAALLVQRRDNVHGTPVLGRAGGCLLHLDKSQLCQWDDLLLTAAVTCIQSPYAHVLRKRVLDVHDNDATVSKVWRYNEKAGFMRLPKLGSKSVHMN